MPQLLSSRSLDGLAAENVELIQLRRNPQLLRRVRFLGDRDRAMIEMSLRHGMSRRQMGMAMGLTAGSITRKLRLLLNRMREPLIVSLTDDSCPLPPDYRQIGIEYFLHRLPIPELARKHCRSRTEIQHMLNYIRGWHRGISQ